MTQSVAEVPAEHTAGEWKQDGLLVYALDDNNEVNRFSARVDGGYEIAFRRGGGDRTKNEELLANARLMAAAPELLDALKLLLNDYIAIAEEQGFDLIGSERDPEVARARAAIAKAKGVV